MLPEFVDVFVEPNPNAPEGSGQRFKAAGAGRAITRLRWEGRWCRVTGWSSEGGGSPCAATAIPVEDSGSGAALLIHGGDWGVRLVPEDGGQPFGEAYLLLDGDTAE
jgi:hypothetical protein